MLKYSKMYLIMCGKKLNSYENYFYRNFCARLKEGIKIFLKNLSLTTIDFT